MGRRSRRFAEGSLVNSYGGASTSRISRSAQRPQRFLPPEAWQPAAPLATRRAVGRRKRYALPRRRQPQRPLRPLREMSCPRFSTLLHGAALETGAPASVACFARTRFSCLSMLRKGAPSAPFARSARTGFSCFSIALVSEPSALSPRTVREVVCALLACSARTGFSVLLYAVARRDSLRTLRVRFGRPEVLTSVGGNE